MIHLREGDALVVYKLDRLARSTKKLIELNEVLEQCKIELISIRDQIDTTTAVGRSMFKMLAVIAELEGYYKRKIVGRAGSSNGKRSQGWQTEIG